MQFATIIALIAGRNPLAAPVGKRIAGLLGLGACLSPHLQCGGDAVLEAPGPAAQTMQIIAPARARAGELLPVVVRALSPSGALDTDFSDAVALTVGAASGPALRLKKGVGSALVAAGDADALQLSVAGAEGSRAVAVADAADAPAYRGVLAGDAATWGPGSAVHVSGDLLVPSGTTLTVLAGTRVYIAAGANILVEGAIVARGSGDDPISFTAADPSRPWGGIEITGPAAEFAHCFFVVGGADPSRAFGHSDSQAVVMARGAELVVDTCYFLDNPGKALGARDSRVSVANSLLTRCDMGGEFKSSLVHMSACHVLDIPDGDGRPDDDDNDGLYFSSPFAGSDAASLVERSFFVTGEDDGIDHNDARLRVEACWIEGYAHEGVAASNGHWVSVYNTLVKDCEQGIEAGYGDPQVFVDHCVVVDNDIGLRFGDSYDWGSEGRMQVSNSIIHGNADNVLNYDLKTRAPVADGISIAHSIVTGEGDIGAPTVIDGVPEFDAAYLLLAGSPGKGSAEDRTDVGLVPGLR